MSRLYVLNHTCGHQMFISRDHFFATHSSATRLVALTNSTTHPPTPISPGTICKPCTLNPVTYLWPYELAQDIELSSIEILAASIITDAIKRTMHTAMMEVRNSRAMPDRVAAPTLEYLRSTYRDIEITLRSKMDDWSPAARRRVYWLERLAHVVKPQPVHCCTEVLKKLLARVGEEIDYNLIELQDGEFVTDIDEIPRIRESLAISAPDAGRTQIMTPVPSEGMTKTHQCLICHVHIGERDADETEQIESPSRLPCGHVFGSACLEVWLADHETCPVCRRKFSRLVYQWPGQNPQQWREPKWIRIMRGEN
ncbi:RING/U-box [Glarea lozoyensis ATCC 20868]|uniref:RING/U-box n=1 Tax=Glarea lozoyensis (strain ATCC 20868 / MF5171) TaxID=1116229 RepID=S3CVU6_GLAL2|nr:RING/U-box [Glarea lozoyensis ATCC 20868]EPE29069.1 RING/U-box [Glarea lozoyensis ATCC 20868]